MEAERYQRTFFPESVYGGFTDIDGTIHFYLRVNALLKDDFIVLDIGCGQGAYKDDTCRIRKELRTLMGKCQRVIGIDIDKSATDNPFLNEFRLIKSDQWPLEDASVDLMVCDYVLEHIKQPEKFLSECKRVLRSGGYFCFRTTNAFGYVALIARLLPTRWHQKLTARVQSGRSKEDVFPTYYRCNTISRIRSYMKDLGFDGCIYTYEAEPSYLEFSKFAYWLGTLHQRYAPKAIKLSIFGFTRKVS
jgi:ubiquinone/menaquinone biosynthesis C-methylase UbiE